MKILILGGGGQVARAVLKATPPKAGVIVKTRQELDISDASAVEAVFSSSDADWVVNGAAYTAVDLAEDHEEQARHINAIAVGVLVRAARRAGKRLLHLSTDFVFDGNSPRAYMPTDAPHPLSSYGRSKWEGEREALTDPGNIVLRTAWIYGSYGHNFVLTMLRLMRERSELRVVCDQIGSPTWAAGIAEAIWGLMRADAHGGIYHWTDLGVASWYDFAVAIHDEGHTRALLPRRINIIPIHSAAYPTKARRPAFSVLDGDYTRRTTRLSGEHWRHNLGKMLDELTGA